MGWVEVCVTVGDADSAESAATCLQPFAVDDIVVTEQIGDPADVNPLALLPEHSVKVYLDTERDSASVRQFIVTALAEALLPPPRFTPLDDVNWQTAWQVHYQPFTIGRLHFRPSWHPADAADSAYPHLITLDPGMAFGTGTHATTRLCLDLLDQVLHPGQSLLDVGTGSGILAIAAAKLGAAPILAIDNDATAVESAQRNAYLNAVHESMTVRQGSAQDVAGDQKWDIVVANILAPIIEQLLREERLGACVAEDGLLILSGILAVQQAQMEAVLQEAGFRPNRILNEGDWIAILAQRVG